MNRFIELIGEIRNAYPNDSFFNDFVISCRTDSAKRITYDVYNEAFLTLDPDSWRLLKHKALGHYMDHRDGQTKQGFFNHLNEAFAYRYLVKKGYSNVSFVPEEKYKRRPDIVFTCNGTETYCEVKSLGISIDEIERRSSGNAYQGGIYSELSDGFLNKFREAVYDGMKQLHSMNADGIIYLVLTFDDISIEHYNTYRKQLLAISAENYFSGIFVKLGITGNEDEIINTRKL